MTSGKTNASIDERAERNRGSCDAVVVFLTCLPKRALERDWLARRRELNAAFARGRKVRRKRTET